MFKIALDIKHLDAPLSQLGPPLDDSSFSVPTKLFFAGKAYLVKDLSVTLREMLQGDVDRLENFVKDHGTTPYAVVMKTKQSVAFVRDSSDSKEQVQEEVEEQVEEQEKKLVLDYMGSRTTLKWTDFRSATLIKLLNHVSKITGVPRFMLLVRVGDVPLTHMQDITRLDLHRKIDWTRFGFRVNQPIVLVASMCRPKDGECAVCLETVSGLDFGSWSEKEPKTRWCHSCFKPLHWECGKSLFFCPSCRSVLE